MAKEIRAGSAFAYVTVQFSNVDGSPCFPSLSIFPLFPRPSTPPRQSSTDDVEDQTVGYQLLAWHKSGVAADGEYDNPMTQNPVTGRREVRTSTSVSALARRAAAAPAAEQPPATAATIHYSAIDEVKTSALHSALAYHRRADGQRPPVVEDVSSYGFKGSGFPSASAERRARTVSLFDPRRHPPEAAVGDAKKRRYVNITNAQLLQLARSEGRNAAAGARSLMLGRGRKLVLRMGL